MTGRGNLDGAAGVVYIAGVNQLDKIKDVTQLLRVLVLAHFGVIVALTGGLINRFETRGFDMIGIAGMVVDLSFSISIGALIFAHIRFGKKMGDV